MIGLVIRRLIQSLVMIVILSYCCFALMSFMPGDPIDMMVSANPNLTSADLSRLRGLYGLDQPTSLRYWNWVKQISSGAFGYSRSYKVPVVDLLGPCLLNTFYLSLSSLLLALALALPLGLWMALRPGSWGDQILNIFSATGIALPSFWLGLMLILVFGIWLPLFPTGGTTSIGIGGSGLVATFADRLSYLVLPTLALSAMPFGRFLRFTRSSMLEALRLDCIRTAKSKGLSYTLILWRHAFRNALIPLITVVTMSFSSLFSGALITETVFAYQGVGKLVYDSIRNNDFNVAMVSFIISMTMVLLFNLLADILYAFADPRVRIQ